MSNIKEILENRDLYRVFGRVNNPLEIDIFLKKFPFSEVLEYYQSQNKVVDYRYFVCLMESNFNEVIKIEKDNKDFMINFIKASENFYSLFAYVNLESFYIIMKYIEDDNELYKDFNLCIGSIASDLIFDYISNSNNDIINAKLLNDNKIAYELFMNNDSRAYRYLSEGLVELKLVKLPEMILNSDFIFEKLKNVDFEDMKKNIDELCKINKSTILYEKLRKYEEELIESYNPSTGLLNYYENEHEKFDPILLTYTSNYEKNSERIFNEMLIDILFNDNYHNVVLNIKEIFRYIKNVDDSIINHELLDLYNKVTSLGELSYEEKMNIYNKYKDKNLNTLFYKDLRKYRDYMLKNMVDQIKLPNTKIKYQNTDIYLLNGEDFNLIIRALPRKFDPSFKINRECFSIINQTNISHFEGDYVYGYKNIDPNLIATVNEDDAYSSDDTSTHYVNRLMTTDELCEYNYINEIQIINRDSKTIKPDYIIAFDSISEVVLNEAKRLEIPIIVINTKVYTTGIKPSTKFDSDRERYM